MGPQHPHSKVSAVQGPAVLCRMADLGMTIVTVVHQPRYGIFILFDEVLVLGKAGRTVYQGPSAAALPYFNSLGFQLPPNENPADFCLDVVSGSIPCQASPDFRPEVGLIYLQSGSRIVHPSHEWWQSCTNSAEQLELDHCQTQQQQCC